MTLAIAPAPAELPREFAASKPSRSASPPVVSVQQDVNFRRDIQPTLERSCVGCHSGDEPQGNLLMTELAPLLRGGETGAAAIVPGLSGESLMFNAVSAKGDGLVMPPVEEQDTYPPLTPKEVALLKRWIDCGRGVARRPQA